MALSVRFHSPYLQPYSQDPLSSLVTAIGGAQRSLEIWSSALTVEAVVEQAASARNRGVLVRWLIDGPTESTERTLARHGFRKQVDWKAYPGSTAGNHQNCLLVDERRVITTSAPFTGEGVYLQDSLGVVVESAEIGAGYGRAFAACWNGAQGTSTWTELVPPVENVCVGPDQRVSAYFTPFDGPILVEKAIEVVAQAETQIYFAVPSLGDPRLIDALEERARAGVHITGVLDARFARPAHFERSSTLRALVMTGKIRAMRPFGGNDYRDGMSLRAIVSDNEWVYVGSPEFTLASSALQAEHALVIDSGPVARQCGAYVEALYQLARRGGHTREDCQHFVTYQSGLAKGRVAPSREAPVTNGHDKAAVPNGNGRARTKPASPGQSFAKKKARDAAKKRVARTRAAG
jgi:phosphatidylserine/phosphatidylglycerophosphate/cardiolipin synthase-like enzyme